MRSRTCGWLAFLGILAGCHSSSSGSCPSCVPEQQVACACPGGATGTQVCASDGAAFSVCACPDGGVDSSAPDATERDSATKDATAGDTASACKTQCDCPANTTCTVGGVCAGTACTEPCSSSSPCSCGQTCVDGFCGKPVGSGTACKYDCDCPAASYEICVAGACTLSCANLDNGPGCGADGGACGACGQICLSSASACVPSGTCVYDTDCAAEGLAGKTCTSNPLLAMMGTCVAPPGTPYVATLAAPVPVGPPSPSMPNQVTVTVPSGGAIASVVVMMDLAQAPPGSPYSVSAILSAPDGTNTMLSLSPGGVLDRIVIPGFGQDAGAAGNDLDVFVGHSRVGTWTMQFSSDPLGSNSPTLTDFRLFLQ